jgi:hypothetical protein
LKTSHEQVLCVLQITWKFLSLRVKKAVRLSSTRRRRACIANDEKHFEHFFDVSFYAFTHNYSLFTLLFSIFLCLFFTLQILSKIHDETQKTLTIKTKITSNDRKI